jgi:hypothetical protein
MDDKKSDEKRGSIRIGKPLAVQFGLQTDGSISWDMSLIKDISESGICLRTGIPLEKGDICYLRFKMPTHPWNSLEITAKVVESAQVKMSIHTTRLEFLDLNEEQKQLLREYVAWALMQERSGK